MDDVIPKDKVKPFKWVETNVAIHEDVRHNHAVRPSSEIFFIPKLEGG
jgi:hypothetical protein